MLVHLVDDRLVVGDGAVDQAHDLPVLFQNQEAVAVGGEALAEALARRLFFGRKAAGLKVGENVEIVGTGLAEREHFHSVFLGFEGTTDAFARRAV